MVYGCGNRCIKALVFGTNLVICLLGGVLLGSAVYVNVRGEAMNGVQDEINKQLSDGHNIDLKTYTTAIWFVCAFGGVLFLIGFIGCCGALHENRFLLGIVGATFFHTYTTVVTAIIVCEITLVVFMVVKKKDFEDDLVQSFNTLNDTSKEALVPVQDWLNCCGTNGTNGVQCDESQTQQDCVTAAWDFFDQAFFYAAGIGALVLVTELCAVFFGCILIRAITLDDKGDI